MNGTFIDFLVERDLAPANTSEYAIQLGVANTMIWAHGAYAATTLPTTSDDM